MFFKKFFASMAVALLIFSFATQTQAARPKAENSVVYTAPLSLYWLSKAGVPEAVEYVQYIDAERILKPENIPQYERIEKINKINAEIRYKSLNDFIQAKGCKNVIDLGCGVSPRCLSLARQGINYVGIDLQEVVNVLNIYAPNFIKDDLKNYVNFVAADVTDKKAMTNAAKNLNGEVCIVMENLSSYLTRDKQKAMLENVREILLEHGGYLITSDFNAGKIFMTGNVAIYGEEDAKNLAIATGKVYESISEVLFSNTMFKSETEAIKFIEDCGLKVEMVPLFTKTPDIKSIRDLNNSDIEKIQNTLNQEKLLWVITADKK